MATIVFGYLKNGEQLTLMGSELKSGEDPRDILSKHLEYWGTRPKEQARAYLAKYMEGLRPRSAKTRTHAERKASEWFAKNGTKRSAKQIQNELDALRQAAGLTRLGLPEWRALIAKENARRKPDTRITF